MSTAAAACDAAEMDEGTQVGGELKYTVTKLDGTPFHWSDFCEGWADAPIRLRRASDAQHAVAFLTEKFGGATWIADGRETPPNVREHVPALVDELDARLALWIAESLAAGEES